MSAEPGWYDDGSGRRRWWDGGSWTDSYLSPETPPPPAAGTQYHPKMDDPSLKPKSSRGFLWGCLGCAAVPLIGLVAFMVAAAFNGNDDYDANNQYEAIAQCEARIKDLLKAPSTAQFDSSATGGPTWTVTGTVDSENGFGAMLRSDFQCTVVISGDTATTTVDFLE